MLLVNGRQSPPSACAWVTFEKRYWYALHARTPPFQLSAIACGYQLPWLPGRWIAGLTALPSSHTRHQAFRFAISSTLKVCFSPALTLESSSTYRGSEPGRATS